VAHLKKLWKNTEAVPEQGRRAVGKPLRAFGRCDEGGSGDSENTSFWHELILALAALEISGLQPFWQAFGTGVGNPWKAESCLPYSFDQQSERFCWV
jgi:hypothetical protein